MHLRVAKGDIPTSIETVQISERGRKIESVGRLLFNNIKNTKL